MLTGSQVRGTRLPDMGSVKIRAEVAAPRLFAGRALALSPDGRSLASGGYQTIEIRDRSTLQLLKTVPGGFKIPSSLVYSPDGSVLAVGDTSGSVAILELGDGVQRFLKPAAHETAAMTNGRYGHLLGVTSLIFYNDGGQLISMGGDNHIKIWDTTTGGLVNYVRCGNLSGNWGVDCRSVLAVDSGRKKMVTASKTGELRLYELETGRLLNSRTLSLGPFVEPSYRLEELAISPDGKTLAGAVIPNVPSPSSKNYRIIVWDISDLQVVSRSKHPLLLPSRNRFATGGEQRVIYRRGLSQGVRMSPRLRSMTIGMSGFFAGAYTASVVPWTPLPKILIVGVVTASVSILVLALTRPKTDPKHVRQP